MMNLQKLALSIDRLLECGIYKLGLIKAWAPSEITIFSLYIDNFFRNLPSKLNFFCSQGELIWGSSNKNLFGCVWVVSMKINTLYFY